MVITSAYEEYALESYELDVVDYLHKPFRFERFLRAVDRARQRRAVTLPPAAPSPVPDPRTHLFVKSDKRTVNLCLADITHLESYGNYVKIWAGAAYTLTPTTLTQLTAELPAEDFLRVHKSFTVNWRQLDFAEGNQLHLRGGQIVPVGKSYRATVRELLR